MATYEIVIKQGESGQNSDNLAGNSDEQQQQQSDNIAGTSNQLKGVLKYAITNSARTLVVSKVGETTRNNLLQRRIDTAFGLVQTAQAFAIDPVFGAINLTISVASQALDYQANASRQASRLSVMAERAGYINRSRND